MGFDLQKGDIAVRAGTVGASGYNFNVLPKFINEPYNHAGIAISPTEIHHVESHGYETVAASTFFSGDSAAEGGVVRFVGKQAALIRVQAAERARKGTYPKIPGNPFSTADDKTTLNCNEFIHELFKAAIKELLVDTYMSDWAAFEDLRTTYVVSPPVVKKPNLVIDILGGNSASMSRAMELAVVAGMQIKDLIEAKFIEFTTYQQITAGAVAGIAEAVGKTQVDNPDVKVKFEGKIEQRNLYPESFIKGWNPFEWQAYSEGFYDVAVLHAYTPNSFINSPFFSFDHKVTVVKTP